MYVWNELLKVRLSGIQIYIFAGDIKFLYKRSFGVTWCLLVSPPVRMYQRASNGRISMKFDRLFQITNLMHNSFILQQYVCYITILNMFRAARCSKHVEDRSVTYILLKNKEIVH